MMKWIILAYLVMNPLFFIPHAFQRGAQEVFYQLSGIVVFGAGLFVVQKVLKPCKLNMGLAFGLLAFVIAWIVSMNGWLIAFNYLVALLVYFTVIRTMEKEDIYFVFKGIAWIMVIATVVLAFQAMGWDYRGTVIARGHETLALAQIAGETPHCSIFGYKAATGMYFAQGILPVICIYPVALLFLIPYGPLYLSYASAPIFGVLCGLLFMTWFRKRILFWLLLIPLIGGFLFYFVKVDNRNFDGNGRLGLWKVVAQDVFKWPAGYGLESFAKPSKIGGWRYLTEQSDEDVIKMYKVNPEGTRWRYAPGQTPDEDLIKLMQKKTEKVPYKSWDHPHNEYLWIGYELGHLGLAVFAFIVYAMWIRFKRSKRELMTCALAGSFVALGITMLAQFNLHIARTAHMVPILLGFFYLWTERETKGETR